METKSVTEVIAAIESNAKTERADVRRIATMSVGECFRQGDVYLVKCDDPGDGLTPTKDRQLAPGTTQGSRHVIASAVDCDVLMPTGNEWKALEWSRDRQPLVYRVIRSRSRLLVEHPEHGHADLPSGCYFALGQLEHAEEVRRVAD